VINDVDSALRGLLVLCLDDDKAQVAFEAPTPVWAAGQDGPTVNLFLTDICEETEGQTGDWEDVRNSEGRVIGRQPPPRRYRLSYVLSVWADQAEDEHRLLGHILETLPERPAIPADLLPGRLRDQGMPVTLRLGEGGAATPATDLFTALGSAPRATCRLTVIVPILPPLETQLEKPAARFDLGVRKEPAHERPVPRQAKRWSDPRITEEAR
jgi:hypothetical protein